MSTAMRPQPIDPAERARFQACLYWPVTGNTGAEFKAIDTLVSRLNDRQRTQVLTSATFLVRGKSGWLYQLSPRQRRASVFVFHPGLGTPVGQLCIYVGPRASNGTIHNEDNYVPAADDALGKMLLIESNEALFWEIGYFTPMLGVKGIQLPFHPRYPGGFGPR